MKGPKINPADSEVALTVALRHIGVSLNADFIAHLCTLLPPRRSPRHRCAPLCRFALALGLHRADTW